MDDKLFNDLIEIGISKETAHAVAVSLNPDHIATQKDVLRLEKLILDSRLSARKDIIRLEQALKKVDMEWRKAMVEQQAKCTELYAKSTELYANSNRQFIITFLGMMLTACVLFAMNYYFH
ncbi:hypothetical protein [Endozoicomonas sp. SESOKO1]|uniref:hypothetical protein n=1 Tax=Endozoicomonas sp. SESOKO1 TaxID=2828742 RepID=UPI00214774F2|nr:hypothetical protein [Endozoicomonas sp. SESOKO1]